MGLKEFLDLECTKGWAMVIHGMSALIAGIIIIVLVKLI